MNETARDEDTHGELSFSDLDDFGQFLALGQFSESRTAAQIKVCHAWLVAQHAKACRWMSDFRALWPPMHKGLDKLRQDLQGQNKQIDALCAGPYSFLAVARLKSPSEDPALFTTYRENIIQLFNTLLRYDAFAKIFDQAYEKADFSHVSYDSTDLDKYRIELSKKLESLGKTLELMADGLLEQPEADTAAARAGSYPVPSPEQ